MGAHMETSYSTDDYVKNWDVVWDYNGQDVFYVDGTGNAYSRGLLLGSDTAFKTNIENIRSPLDKLLKLHGVMYNFKNRKTTTDTIKIKDHQGVWHIIPPTSRYIDTSNFEPGVIQRIFKEREMKHLGVLAQEVEKVVPELVRMQTDGYLAVEYCSIIGLIIEAIKEQQEQIQTLNDPSSPIKTGIKLDTITFNSNGDNYLYQNAPNPFSKSTVIKFKISSSAREASIMIFNMQGTLLKTYSGLNDKFEITVYGREFNPGMYLYSLVVDGSEVSTKRMILTE